MNPLKTLLRLLKLDVLAFIVIAAALSGLLIRFNAFEQFKRFAALHERWQLDDLALSLVVCGALGYLFAARYIFMLREEVRMRELAERGAQDRALHDALTGLPNRIRISQHFDALSDARVPRFFVCILDLDGFKAVNDLYGHAIGDKLLQEVSRRLRERIQAPDFIGRLSGDEFAIILRSATDETAAQAFLGRIAEALQAPCLLDGTEVRISATFGVAHFPQDGRMMSHLLRRADVALYQGKAFHRSSIRFFNAELDQRIERRAQVAAAVRTGLSKDSLYLLYQPIIDLRSGHTCGFEALARLVDPELGNIPPAEFIEDAEHSGLILQLSDHLLRMACRDACSWPAHLSLAFNLSPVQLLDPSLVERLSAIIADSGIDPQRLMLEVTEVHAISDSDRADNVFHGLRAIGVRIALDDFGTGYSTFARLMRFPFDQIKLDRSLIQGIGRTGREAQVLDALVHMAEVMATESLAEGIETAAQRDWLIAHGCRYGQGYLFSRPLARDHITAWLVDELRSPINKQLELLTEP